MYGTCSPKWGYGTRATRNPRRVQTSAVGAVNYAAASY